MTPPTLRSVALALAAALLVLAAYWFPAWSSVRVLLADDAQARVAAWDAHATPWHWDFGRPGMVVWPGSTGFARDDTSVPGLAGAIPDGNADLSLDLRGESIDMQVVDGAVVRLDVKQPVRVSLLTGGGFGTEVAAATVSPPGGVVTLTKVDNHGVASSAVLRLHLQSAPGARLVLHRAALTPRAGLRPQACASLDACEAVVPRLVAPAFLFPESLLAWRDGVLRASPAAIVEPARATGRVFAADVRDAMHGAWAWVLALAPVFVGLMSRLRVEVPSRRMVLLELALVFSPWLLLQWAGWPADDAPAGAAWVFIGALVGALLLQPLEPSNLLGNKAAWRSSMFFLAAAAGVIGVLALVNATDVDGFAPRAVSATKGWQYPLWALIQQAILLRAIAPRMRLALANDAHGAFAAGALFGALHLPNFALMVATFAAGTAWAAIGRRHPALLPLAVAHAASGIALVWAAPAWLLRSAEIGGRYLMAP